MHLVYVKLHKHSSETLLAACDEDILGQVFLEGKLKLDVCEAFYGGDKVSDEKFVSMLEMATIANLTGPHVVKLAIREGLVAEECVLTIAGVPHAQIAAML